MQELIRRLKARPGLTGELLVASFFVNILALASPIFVIQVLNRYVAHGVDATLATLTTGVVLAIVLEFAFRQVRLKLAHGVSRKPDEKLSADGFRVLTSAKSAAMDQLPAGLRREIITGVDAVRAAYNPPNVTAILDVPFAIIFVVALFLINPILSYIVAFFLISVFIVALVTLSSLRNTSKEMIAVSGRRNGLVTSAMTSADTVRAFNGAGFLRGLWNKERHRIDTLAEKITARHGLVQSITQSTQAGMSVAIIAVAALLVVSGQMDIGNMIGANILAARALGPIVKLAQLSEVFAKARQALGVLNEFFKMPLEKGEGSALRNYRGGIEFRDVAFSHPRTPDPLFESLDLKLEPGSILVVSGTNGAGKTTLARLILGLLEPIRGHILVDGVDLTQVAPEWWRRQVVYLPQEPSFLNATIRQNILAFNPELDDEGLNKLVDAAGLREYIDTSPQGLETPLSETGKTLALGIRRRIALARGLATGGKIAVFDEPAEGLDNDGRAQVNQVMNDLARQGATIIAFSHDPNTLKGAPLLLDLNSKPVPRVVKLAKDANGNEQQNTVANEAAQ